LVELKLIHARRRRRYGNIYSLPISLSGMGATYEHGLSSTGATNGDSLSRTGAPSKSHGCDKNKTKEQDFIQVGGKSTCPPSASPPADFAEFWNLYPARGGKKREKAKAVAQWKRLSAADRSKAVQAAPLYAAGEKQGFHKDAFRWLRDSSFDDWLDAPEPDQPQGRLPETAADFAAAGYILIEDDD